MIYFTLAVLGFMFSAAYIFVKISEKYGLTKGFISLMIVVDIYTVAFMLLGIDRPLFIIYTRLGSITVTALMLFLIIKIPFTIWTIARTAKLQKILG